MKFTLNELTYDFHIRNIIKLLTDLLTEAFNQLRLIKREKIDNVIIFINAIIKTRYDNNHKIIKFHERSSIYLRLYYDYFILNINFKLFN